VPTPPASATIHRDRSSTTAAPSAKGSILFSASGRELLKKAAVAITVVTASDNYTPLTLGKGLMKTSHRTCMLIPAAMMLIFAAVMTPRALANDWDDTARALLNLSMDAMGGQNLLASLKTLKLEIHETQFRLDDSERNASPWWSSNLKITETRDLDSQRYRMEAEVENPQFVYSQSIISDGNIIAIGRTRNGKTGWASRPETHERLQLSPERILFAAAQATDLKEWPNVSIHDVMHHDLRFTWMGFRVDVFINANTHLPDRIASVRTSRYDIAQNAWGDIQWSTDFLFWKREPDGLAYPRQWNTLRNGAPILVDSVISLAANPLLEDGTFEIPADAQKDFAANGHVPVDEYPFDGSKQITSIGKDVWLIAGNWNVLVVKQEDGLVVIECPQSAGYSAKVLDFLRQRFPDVRVKALVSTTDSTWHYAGLRTYIARAIPAYALDLNVSLLQTFLAAPHILAPDEYARAKRSPDLRAVADRTVIGKGASRMELYPVRGESDERMIMVYFPELQLLYGSSNDLFDTGKGGKTGTFNLSEVVDAARARHLEVTTYAGIHTAATPWEEVLNLALAHPASH
jgi:hypothetical protein